MSSGITEKSYEANLKCYYNIKWLLQICGMDVNYPAQNPLDGSFEYCEYDNAPLGATEAGTFLDQVSK
jgi:hypothetical protein